MTTKPLHVNAPRATRSAGTASPVAAAAIPPSPSPRPSGLTIASCTTSSSTPHAYNPRSAEHSSPHSHQIEEQHSSSSSSINTAQPPTSSWLSVPSWFSAPSTPTPSPGPRPARPSSPPCYFASHQETLHHPAMAKLTKVDIPVIIHNGKRGLLTIENGFLDVLQLSSDGRPPKHLLSAPVRLLLRAHLSPAPSESAPQSPITPTTATSTRLGTSSRRSSRVPVPSNTRKLDIHALVQKSPKSHHLHYTKIRVLVEPTHFADAEQWVNNLMAAAYPVSNPYRNVLLLINPIGGKGKAPSICKNTVIPILEAAGCKVQVQTTQHRYHGEEIAASVDLSKIDVIAIASGDGGIYEVLNGLAGRPDGCKALRIPIAPLPTGSGCASCNNLFGPKDAFNVPLATLNIIKGQPMPVDLQSVLLLPSRKRRVSFLSVALGLMVDLDLGTEHIRWMGDARFVYGFVRGAISNKPCKARIRLDIVEDDKEAMAAVARKAAADEKGQICVGSGTDPLGVIRGVQELSVENAQSAYADGFGSQDSHTPLGSRKSSATSGASDSPTQCDSAMPMSPAFSTNGAGTPLPLKTNGTASKRSSLEGEGRLPPQRELVPTDKWLTMDSTTTRKGPRPDVGYNKWVEGDSMCFLYAGLMPYVSRDLNQWPVALAGSGVIDLVVQRVISRTLLVTSISGAEVGNPYWFDSQLYYKVRAYTVENLDKKNQPSFTLDGEAYDWDTFHVEVLPRGATLMSLDGRFFHSPFVFNDYTGVKKK